jgi:hypothetical protein
MASSSLGSSDGEHVCVCVQALFGGVRLLGERNFFFCRGFFFMKFLSFSRLMTIVGSSFFSHPLREKTSSFHGLND